MTIVSETKHVQMFKIYTKLNKMKHMSFRLYPKTGPVPEAPAGYVITSWNRHSIRLALLDVAERRRCRKMFTVQSHEPRTITR